MNGFLKNVLVRCNNLIAQISLKETIERIASTKTAPDGKKWEKTKNKTYRVARKRDGFRYFRQSKKEPKNSTGDASSGSLLYRTSGLLQSVKVARVYDKISEGSVSTLVSSNLAYAVAHQYGSDLKNIPARPFLGISQVGKNKVLEFASNLFTKELLKSTKNEIEKKGK